jgi:phytoene dehydrogenase-like protein
VIGAGHNGLVAAAYLAGADAMLVLERRELVGGCVVTGTVAGFV